MTGRERHRLIFGGTALGAAILLQALARGTSGFGEWYATHIYPVLVGSISRILSPLPFSVSEFLLYGLIVWMGVAVVILIRRAASGVGSPWKAVRSGLTGLFCLASALLFVYTVTCGINYYRQTFSTVAGFELKESSNEELLALCEELAGLVNETAPLLKLDEEGRSVLSGNVRAISREAMEQLGTKYSCLSGYYPLPKPLVVSKLLAVQQLCGIYSPFTIEANYNREMTPYNIPFTVCHELSHLKGFMREDEANFIAFLACRDSESAQFRYSAYLMAYIHSTNALYRSAGAEAYQAVHESLCITAQRDLVANNVYWDQYDTKVAEVANNMNDTYLRANSQSDGVKSYGRMVDLLLADYRARHK